MFKKLVLRVIVYGLLLIGALFMFQDSQLYFPDTPPLATVLDAAQRDRLQAWPSATDYRGLRREPKGPARATLLLFHGNAGHAGHRAPYAELDQLGLRVILAEYPAYGPRPGKLGEKAMVADAVATLALVRQQYPGPLLLAGESLGAGVAAAAFAKSPDGISGVLLITPWDRLKNVASHHFPWLPVGLLLRDQYDSVANLAAARVPLAVVIAAQDTIVPPAFGQALYEHLPPPKKLWRVPGAEHNDWMDRVDADWWSSLIDFLLTGQVQIT
jgi:hypothetical protein